MRGAREGGPVARADHAAPTRLTPCLLLGLALACAPMPRAASAQQPAEVRAEAGAGSLGLGWRAVGPFTVGADGHLVASRHAEVTGVRPCSPAHVAGVEPGDVLLAVNGRDGRSGGLFPDAAPGTPYELRIRRGPETLTLRFEVGPPARERTEPVTAPPVGTPEAWGCRPDSGLR